MPRRRTIIPVMHLHSTVKKSELMPFSSESGWRAQNVVFLLGSRIYYHQDKSSVRDYDNNDNIYKCMSRLQFILPTYNVNNYGFRSNSQANMSSSNTKWSSKWRQSSALYTCEILEIFHFRNSLSQRSVPDSVSGSCLRNMEKNQMLDSERLSKHWDSSFLSVF